jgi:hypothetical protein
MQARISMIFFLGTPQNQIQAHLAEDMPVLLSYGAVSNQRWIDRYIPTFSSVLVDSGAFSELNSGKKIDLMKYVEFAESIDGVEAWAGLDDISGDWKRSMNNYKYGGFPTYHDTDPEGILPELIAMARERFGWLGIGLKPPRLGRSEWCIRTLSSIPDDIHVHGWAMYSYAYPRFDSVDSTNWFRDAWKILNNPLTMHLSPAEAIEVIVKRYKRSMRCKRTANSDQQISVFEGLD